jgi:hypothetical protein
MFRWNHPRLTIKKPNGIKAIIRKNMPRSNHLAMIPARTSGQIGRAKRISRVRKRRKYGHSYCL